MIGRYRMRMHYCVSEMPERGETSTGKVRWWQPNKLKKSETAYKSFRKYVKKCMNGHRFIIPQR